MDTQQGSLLLVDDDDVSRELLGAFLTRRGFTVNEVSDGQQALDSIARGGQDLVLLDILMDGLSGLEVLQQIRQTRRTTELPIIMATSRDKGRDVVEALQLGANDYVTKPFDFPVVLARIQTQLALKRSVDQILRLEQDLARQNVELQEANRRMKRDLETAAKVQAALLPRTMPVFASATFAWAFKPCTELAGDLLNVVVLDERRVALYVLDVVGHGAAAALLAAMVTRVLALYQRDVLPAERGIRLTEMATHLSQEFPRDTKTEQYFTLLYGVLDLNANSFRFVSAGHPGPAYLASNVAARNFKVPGFPIGILDKDDVFSEMYTESSLTLESGDRLFLYSDGLVEALDPNQKQFGVDRLLNEINRTRTLPLKESVTSILQTVEDWSSPALPHDDISILAVERTSGLLRPE